MKLRLGIIGALSLIFACSSVEQHESTNFPMLKADLWAKDYTGQTKGMGAKKCGFEVLENGDASIKLKFKSSVIFESETQAACSQDKIIELTKSETFRLSTLRDRRSFHFEDAAKSALKMTVVQYEGEKSWPSFYSVEWNNGQCSIHCMISRKGIDLKVK